MKKVLTVNTDQTVQGRIRCQVVRAGRVVQDMGWQKNLILNQGLDQVAVRSWLTCTDYCVCGTGTTDTHVDSGLTTANQVGTTVTLSGGSFVFTNTATDAGKYIKWDTLETARIVTVTSPTVVEVHVNQSVSAGEFTTINAQQLALSAEVKRTNTYLDGAGNTEVVLTNLATGIQVCRRTYDFAAEVGSATYSEIGFSYSNAAGSNLFSRIKLVAPAVLVLGDVLRVVYELRFTMTPYTPTAHNVVFTGAWGTQAGMLMRGVVGLSSYNVGGSTNNGGYWNHEEPSSSQEIMVSKQNFTQPAVMGYANSVSFSISYPSLTFYKSPSLAVYVSLSFTRTKTITCIPSECNLTGITDLFMANRNSSTIYPGIWFKFTTPQTKDNTHTLVVNLVYTWGRTL